MRPRGHGDVPRVAEASGLNQGLAGGPTPDTLRGVVTALVAYFMFASGDTLVKLLTQRHTVFEIMAVHVFAAMLPLAVVVGRDGVRASLRLRQPRLLAVRAALAGVGTTLAFMTFSRLPLADAYAIIFCMPLVVSVAAVPLLGERLGLRRFLAVLAGLVGVLVMVRPGGAPLSLGHLVAFSNVGVSAAAFLIIRRIGASEPPAAMLGAVITGMAVVSLPVVLLVGRWPTGTDLLLAVLSGVLMGSAQLVIVDALRRAPAGVVAPMLYTVLIWAAVYGWFVFGQTVQPNVLAGAVIVIAASLYVMRTARAPPPR